jgi:hypothetical protein
MIPNGAPERADTAEVSPHRYTWDNDRPDLDDFSTDQWKEMRAAVEYQPGDVVYVIRNGKPVKALVLNFFIRRSDWDGSRKVKFRIAVATAKGEWSKLWEHTHPGFIQRAYLEAGMAPDLEGKL